MIDISPALGAAFAAAECRPVDLYELYLDSGTLYFADQDITWGGHHYLPMVTGRSAIRRYMDGQFDDVTVTFSNVDTTIAQALLPEEIEGRRIIIRKIDRTVAADSIVMFDGRMDRPQRFTDETGEISAKHFLGSVDFDAPARLFGPPCDWPFKGTECGYVGAETECNKSWARCSQLGQTARYSGFRFVPHSGIYQYQETKSERFLLLFRRKKTKTLTASFASVDDTPYDTPIPILYGRVMLAGVVIQHEDQGATTVALVAFGIGKVNDFFYVRANERAVTVYTKHYGTFGLGSDQLVDPRFPSSYPYSQLAYLGVTIPSDVKAVDPAPNVTALIMGREVALFAADGSFVGSGWTDNPVWNTRDFMSLPLVQGGMGVPEELIDDVALYETAAYCDELIANATNDQKIYNPVNLPSDVDYQRYQSTGVDGQDPTTEGPRDDFEPGVDDDTDTTPAPVNVKRFTMNVALAKQEKAIDILFKKLLPSFRGYLTQSADGKIQIRSERPVKNTALTAGSVAGAVAVTCAPAGWAAGDLVLLSPYTTRAETATVDAVLGGGLQFTAPLAYAHSIGEVAMKVAMAFDDSTIVGSFEYPLSDRQSSTNRVTIKYVDAPAGFVERQLNVNDYEHQAKVHHVNSEDVDGGAIDSYFQAWRIGEWLRAKRRDLGKFCAFGADIRATVLEVGDVIVASAAEVGLQAVPFLVVEAGFEESDEVSLVGQLYSLDVYSDTAPQATVTVPTVFPQASDPVKVTFAGSAAVQGQAYAGSLVAAGGTAPYAYAISSGALPAGLTLDAATGSITGTPSAAGKTTFTGRATDAKGATATIVCTILVALPGGSGVDGSITGLTGTDDTSARWKESLDSPLHAVVNVAITLGAYPRPVTLWVGKVGGPKQWRGQWQVTAGGTLVVGAQGTSAAGLFPPTLADESWAVTAALGWYGPGDAVPAGAVTSAAFTMHRPVAPAGGLVTSLTVAAGVGGDFPYMRRDDDNGYQDWCVPWVRSDFTAAAAVAEVAFAALTTQDLDAAGNPIGIEHLYGVVGVTAGVYEWGDLAGPYGTEAVPARSGPIAGVRLREYLISRSTTMLWSDATCSTLQVTTDVTVAVGGAVPDGTIPADRLDPTTLGHGIVRDSASGKPKINTTNLGNLTLNGNFENWMSGWGIRMGAPAVIADPSAMTQPNLLNLVADVGGNAGVYEVEAHACRPGDEIYTEAYCGSSGTGTLHLEIWWFNDTRAWDGTNDAADAATITGVPEWTPITLRATAPAGASSYRVVLTITGVTAGLNWVVDNVYTVPQVPAGVGTEADGRGGVKAKLATPLAFLGDQITIANQGITNQYLGLAAVQATNMHAASVTAANAALDANSVVDSNVANVGVAKLIAGAVIFTGDVAFSRGSGNPVIVLNNTGMFLYGVASGTTGLTSSPYVAIQSTGIGIFSGGNQSVTMSSTLTTWWSVNGSTANPYLAVNSLGLLLSGGSSGFSVNVTISQITLVYSTGASLALNSGGLTVTNGSFSFAATPASLTLAVSGGVSMTLTASALTILYGSYSFTATASSLALAVGGGVSMTLTASALTILNGFYSFTASASSLALAVSGGVSMTLTASGLTIVHGFYSLTVNASSVTLAYSSGSQLVLTFNQVLLQGGSNSLSRITLDSSGNAVFTEPLGTSTTIKGNRVTTGSSEAGQFVGTGGSFVVPFYLTCGFYSTASAGGATLPANPSGFFETTLNGTVYKVPVYGV